MKKVTLYLIIILVPYFTYAQNTGTNDTYDFPVKPGTAAWKSFKSKAEKLKACQIPNDKLASTSTLGLLKTCLNYPFFSEIFAFNTIQEGYKKISSDFNGFQELLRRKDLTTVITNEYMSANPNLVKNYSSNYDKGKFCMNILFMELLMSQDALLERLDNQSINNLLQETIKKFDQKIQLKEPFDILSHTSTAYLTGKIMNRIDPTFPEKRKLHPTLDNFISTSDLTNKDDLNYLYNEGKNYFINKK